VLWVSPGFVVWLTSDISSIGFLAVLNMHVKSPLITVLYLLFMVVSLRPSSGAVIGRAEEGNKTAWELTEALYGTSGLRSFNGTWITGWLLIGAVRRPRNVWFSTFQNLVIFVCYHLVHIPRGIIVQNIPAVNNHPGNFYCRARFHNQRELRPLSISLFTMKFLMLT